MARVTVEDCLNKVDSKFELVALATQRAKDIGSGTPITVDRDNDKNAVIALREIATGNMDMDKLREEIILNLQQHRQIDEVEEENLHAEVQEDIEAESDYSSDNIDFTDDLDIDADSLLNDENTFDDK